ncbi:MAG: preprotein translocase subunit SecG [Zetaproteobacteria bacterium CG_4_9_14_3_um_filter_49_83]|nr:MAG: preprotein translocase subunit SecG [Zetaproteobacteria bacterium CG1_02_49_23]PIQ31775.1 MAG: preprotein translocase subunit SecG [Zetaproteobacteria bacterium CG17_big_fil_post_rev_8_21_14_2_50_50_13]PIV31412.1 MAG: preprotein translocase subunit SecG [Zetaproteobacteria bacterium CG02_land_8_20_14_3_00_50_9]PIY56646.1 MAG: preprotein translocase subunit SecG [Zetaproteobacteria bacterium CG_4_10_14_0_8_um_filter_49_80]PJA34201.1 MAG: preprotein translocase subunit SecG [Zetaproteobac
MTAVIVVIHIIVAVLLIGVILVQRGQGADMGASFGGGSSQTLFGSRGSGSFLGKLTGGLAATFMVTSLTLAFFTQQNTGSVVDRSIIAPAQQSAPASNTAAPTLDPADLKETTQPAESLPAAE